MAKIHPWPITLMHMASTERAAGHESVLPQVAVRVALAFAWEAEVRRECPDAIGTGFRTRPSWAAADDTDPETIFQTLIERIQKEN